MKKIIFALLATSVLSLTLAGQVPTQFSGDTATFTSELTTFMGTLVSKPEKAELDLFNAYYDSTCYSRDVKDAIINVASQLRSRRLSQIPGFLFFIRTLTDFIDTGQKHDEV